MSWQKVPEYHITLVQILYLISALYVITDKINNLWIYHSRHRYLHLCNIVSIALHVTYSYSITGITRFFLTGQAFLIAMAAMDTTALLIFLA